MSAEPREKNASQSRLERWQTAEHIALACTWDEEPSPRDEECMQLLHRVHEDYRAKHGIPPSEMTSFEWIRQCHELIYDVVDANPVIHAIAYTFNVSRAELQLSHVFDILFEEPPSSDADDEIRSTLAYALFAEVPVLPNTEELAGELARHYRDLMIEGFTAPDESGGRMRLMPTGSPGRKLDSVDYLREFRIARPSQPAEFAILRTVLERELNRLSTADRVLAELSIATEELESQLSASIRNESAIQKCLTTHPILFGLEYQRIIPKHMLGAEYEMDYALERVSGQIDLVEIEASVHQLFTQAGDPRKEVVHAEQQVLDWLEWLERNHSYARGALPGLMRPRGFVVIGRSSQLTPDERRKLDRRNLIFGESLQVLTYDDLLSRAKNMRQLLVGST